MPRSRHSPRYTRLKELLVRARADAGLSQVEVAARLGRPQSFVSKYESGERGLDVVELIEVCAVLGFSPEVLVVMLIETAPED